MKIERWRHRRIKDEIKRETDKKARHRHVNINIVHRNPIQNIFKLFLLFFLSGMFCQICRQQNRRQSEETSSTIYRAAMSILNPTERTNLTDTWHLSATEHWSLIARETVVYFMISPLTYLALWFWWRMSFHSTLSYSNQLFYRVIAVMKRNQWKTHWNVCHCISRPNSYGKH